MSKGPTESGNVDGAEVLQSYKREKISPSSYKCLYDLTLGLCLDHLKEGGKGELQSQPLFRTMLKALTSITISASAQEAFRDGRIDKYQLSAVIDDTRNMKKNDEFVDALIEACMKDAAVRLVQEETERGVEGVEAV